jgi:hypothetical protein
MPTYSRKEQARLNAGLCMDCGAPRAGVPGATERRCPDCAAADNAKRRAYRARLDPDARRRAANGAPDVRAASRQKWLDARRDAGLCVQCGKPREAAAAGPTPSTERCAACAARCRREANARNKKRRDEADAQRLPWQCPPRPAPQRIVGGIAVSRTFLLDIPSYKAFREIKHREQQAIRSAGRTPPWAYQNSRIVREVICRYETMPCLPRLGICILRPYPLGVSFDARSWAILKREADAHFNGNRSACLREMIQQTAVPQAVVARRPLNAEPRWERDPWRD